MEYGTLLLSLSLSEREDMVGILAVCSHIDDTESTIMDVSVKVIYISNYSRRLGCEKLDFDKAGLYFVVRLK